MGYLFFTPSFEGNPFTQRLEILSRKTFCAAHSKDFVILPCAVLTGLQSVTYRQTDRRTGGRTDP